MTARKIKITATLIITVATLVTLQGCGSSGGGDTFITPSPTVAPGNITISANNDTHLTIEWDFVRSADHFHVHEDRAGTSNYAQIAQATDVYALSSTFNIPVHKLNWGTTQYGVEACDLNDTTRLMSDPITLPSALSPAAIGYFKASNTGANDWFGWSIALSGDGLTLAVGAKQEDGSTPGINGSDNNSAGAAGAVYVFRLTGTTWAQEAYVKPFNVGAGDQFGQSVALSADGNTLAVGAHHEDSDTIGINGPDNDNSDYTGAVYVFTRSGTTWTQQAYVKAFNTGANDEFGYSVSISSDGNTLAVGARQEDSDSTGVNNPDNNLRDNSGAAYVFTRSGTTWTQQAYIKASNPDSNDEFGTSLAISPDGNTLVVGSYREESNATGINGNQGDNTVDESGAAYVFYRTGTTWVQQAYIKAADVGMNDHFSWALALSSDGNTLAVGSHYEDSNSQGIGGDPSNNTGINSGAVYIYTRSGSTWSQQEYIKSSNSEGSDQFGWSVALTADGNTLAVGALLENSAATGINGNQGSSGAPTSGAVYLFSRSGATWTQDTYVKASNTGSGDHFGYALAINADGNRLVASAETEDSPSTGIGGSQADNSASAAGAVYVY